MGNQVKNYIEKIIDNNKLRYDRVAWIFSAITDIDYSDPVAVKVMHQSLNDLNEAIKIAEKETKK